jgi:acyl carrier protein
VLAARSFVSGARVDWATLFAGQGAHSIDVSAPAAEGHWLADLAQDRPREAVPPEPTAEQPVTALRERLSQLPSSAHRGVLLDAVRALAAQVLESDAIRSEPGERTFQQLGFSSLTAVEFRDRLGTAAGVALSATVIFDYPSLGALAEHVGAELGKDPTGVAAAALTALAALETTVRGLDESPELRVELADRLAALLAEVAPAAVEARGERDIDDATSEEMLAYLDQKFLSK